ncbi:unnamed protein product [Clavelina lepadiformis]|uniref:Uncharacterized protein n=1 Tax=Clavelina lepadiformis TaxID=159417 RepID=A0ABP0FIW4_CLALP
MVSFSTPPAVRDRKEQLHDEQLFHTLLPTMQNLNFNARFHPNTNPSMKWSHFARCRCPNPNPPIEWSHFARCDRSLSLNPENLETGIVFNLFGREQFHHRELVQTPFPTMLTLNFKSDFTPNPNPSINRSHFARCDRTLGSNPTNLETGIVFILDRKEQLHDEQLFHTLLPTMQNLNFNARFHPNPNPSMKWSHFARCRWSISSNPEDLETGIVFNLFGREQFHHTELVQTPFPTMPTTNFQSDFTPNPNPSIKWSHFARCDRTLGSNPTNLETGIIFILDRKEQLHDEQLFHMPLPTMQNLNFNARFHPKPNPSMKWSHFARCRWSISPNPEDLETGIVFNLFGREQFHHTELVQTPFPTMLTLNFRSDFTSNPNPSIKWSHFARCRWSISLNPEDLETDRKEQLHDEQLFHTLLPTMQNLNFNARFHPNTNPSMKWSHFARCRCPNPNPPIEWSHFARCDRSLSLNPENLETGIVFNLFGREQFHHRELVQTPFPTMLTLNFKSDFTPNPNPSINRSHFARCDRTLGSNPTNLETDRKEQLHDEQLFHTLLPTMQNLNFNARFHPNPNPSMKWSHFARCRWSISSNPEDLETGIVFNLFGREQFHHTELVQTPFPTMPTTNFQSDFTPNPNPSIKWSHFARCDRTLGSNPTNLETGIIFILDRKEQLHDEQLFHMPLPTMQNLNFNARFHPKPNPSMKWSHFARCRWSISPNPEDLETGIVFNLFGREQFHHTELVQTPFPTMLTLNFKSDFTPNLNLSIKWSHFARCDRSLSPNPENLENGIVFNLFGRKQFHHTELVQTPFPTILTLNVKGAYTSNPSPSINRNHFAKCDRSLGSNPTNLETGIVFILDRKEQLHDEQLFHTLLPTMQNLNFNARFHPNPNPSMKWSHFARCRW